MMTDDTKIGLGIEDIIGNKRETVLKLAAQHGASNVRVFGSVARGEAHPDSDLDLLLHFSHKCSVFDLVDLYLDLKEVLKREVSIVPDDHLEGDFRANALKDAVPL